MRSIYQILNNSFSRAFGGVAFLLRQNSNKNSRLNSRLNPKRIASLFITTAGGIFCLLSLASCTSGESATSSGGASFTNVGGNWRGLATPSDTASSVDMSLSIVFSSESIINGTASFGSQGAPCLISGPLTGTASNGQVTFTITNTTLTFAGTASTDHMEGTFVATAATTTAETATCQGQSGSWRASR